MTQTKLLSLSVVFLLLFGTLYVALKEWPIIIQSYGSENYPTTIGNVKEIKELDRPGRRGGFEIKKIVVDFIWDNKTYRTTSPGLSFDEKLFNKVRKTRSITVWVNELNPQKSVLSPGVPWYRFFLASLVSIVSLLLLILSIMMIKKSY